MLLELSVKVVVSLHIAKHLPFFFFAVSPPPLSSSWKVDGSAGGGRPSARQPVTSGKNCR